MKIEVSLCISRNSNDEISISFSDKASRIEFVDARFTLEEFAKAITGLGFVPSKSCEVRGLEHVGKIKVTEERSIKCLVKSYSREFFKEWLEVNAQEEGWILDSYLGTKSSLTHDSDGGVTLNYHVHKYVENDNQTTN